MIPHPTAAHRPPLLRFLIVQVALLVIGAVCLDAALHHGLGMAWAGVAVAVALGGRLAERFTIRYHGLV